VLVLLPPSETKTAPPRGKPLDVTTLSFPELNDRRQALIDALDDLGPTAPASRIYTGVLYNRLRLPELRARNVLIFSALFGVVRPGDRIPAYRLNIGARLPGIGPLAAFWRPALARVLEDRGVILDLRSGAYAAAWAPKQATVVTVRGLTPDGRVVSHGVKHTRGEVARIALQAKARSPRAIAAAVEAAGHRVELAPERGGWRLDVTPQQVDL
jgi:cytoplasmic iron level regulating protein YaaA (DUF328/UPF0246 family)